VFLRMVTKAALRILAQFTAAGMVGEIARRESFRAFGIPAQLS
jgi:hypothetical protein